MSAYELALIAPFAALIVLFVVSASQARAYRKKAEEALWTLEHQAQAVAEQSHKPGTVTAHLYVDGKRLDADVRALAESIQWQRQQVMSGWRP
jgi:type II secretory pathway pseudopilin PulG